MNITPQLVANNDKTAELVALLEREGCDPRGLTIEVTEQAVISELDVARDRLRTCRKLGFEISLDDFGTGYSSLAMLRQLPLDSIKIDRSFVSGVSDDHADLSIVQATIELAHHLGMHVVAEGVETEEQAATLLDLGCRRAQGYLFAAALSPQDFFARLVAQQAPELSEELASYHDVVEAGRTS
jgi:EAL domain-containing protein (putative c-di-GMP-specific phosphodiesterase class I)